MMSFTLLVPHEILAAQSNYLWINMLAVAIIAVAAIAAAVALKKT
jgi:hypothetical protein